MIGLINVLLRQFITEAFGASKWDEVTAEAGLQNKDWTPSYQPYDDNDTYQIAGATCKVLGVDLATALELFGQFFVKAVTRDGYERLLRSLGGTLAEFMSNLNVLHMHLEFSFPEMEAPAFRCDEVTPTQMTLHYYSTRPALGPLVVGIIKAIAAEYFKHEVTLTPVMSRDEGADHDAWRVEYPFQENLLEWKDSIGSLMPYYYQMPPEVFGRSFPFHLLIDNQCRVIQAGQVLRRLYPELVPGADVRDTFEIERPLVDFDFTKLMAEAEAHMHFILSSYTGLELKGQAIIVNNPRPGGSASPGGTLLGDRAQARDGPSSRRNSMMGPSRRPSATGSSVCLDLVPEEGSGKQGPGASNGCPDRLSPPGACTAQSAAGTASSGSTGGEGRLAQSEARLAQGCLAVSGAGVGGSPRPLGPGPQSGGRGDEEPAALSGEFSSGGHAFGMDGPRCPFTAAAGLAGPRERRAPSSSGTNTPNRSRSRRRSVLGPSAAALRATHEGGSPALLFLLSPRIKDLEELQSQGLFLADIPLWDVSRDLLLLSEQRRVEVDLQKQVEVVGKQLQESNAKLQEVGRWLAEEKKRSDELLYSMLPGDVADEMRAGQKSVARHLFLTALFCDIVNFTVISSKCTPLQIAEMLNQIYERFDDMLEHQFPDCYKVDTIGDAVLIVCGMTTPVENHADLMVDLSLELHECVKGMQAPSGDSIQLRIGIHTGDCVGVVVGRKTPRFTVVGDTVNTAARMESHGVPGRIHISSATYSLIKAKQRYAIQERGIIQIKGKGEMKTYLISDAQRPASSQATFPASTYQQQQQQIQQQQHQIQQQQQQIQQQQHQIQQLQTQQRSGPSGHSGPSGLEQQQQQQHGGSPLTGARSSFTSGAMPALPNAWAHQSFTSIQSHEDMHSGLERSLPPNVTNDRSSVTQLAKELGVIDSGTVRKVADPYASAPTSAGPHHPSAMARDTTGQMSVGVLSELLMSSGGDLNSVHQDGSRHSASQAPGSGLLIASAGSAPASGPVPVRGGAVQYTPRGSTSGLSSHLQAQSSTGQLPAPPYGLLAQGPALLAAAGSGEAMHRAGGWMPGAGAAAHPHASVAPSAAAAAGPSFDAVDMVDSGAMVLQPVSPLPGHVGLNPSLLSPSSMGASGDGGPGAEGGYFRRTPPRKASTFSARSNTLPYALSGMATGSGGSGGGAAVGAGPPGISRGDGGGGSAGAAINGTAAGAGGVAGPAGSAGPLGDSTSMLGAALVARGRMAGYMTRRPDTPGGSHPTSALDTCPENEDEAGALRGLDDDPPVRGSAPAAPFSPAPPSASPAAAASAAAWAAGAGTGAGPRGPVKLAGGGEVERGSTGMIPTGGGAKPGAAVTAAGSLGSAEKVKDKSSIGSAFKRMLRHLGSKAGMSHSPSHSHVGASAGSVDPSPSQSAHSSSASVAHSLGGTGEGGSMGQGEGLAPDGTRLPQLGRTRAPLKASKTFTAGSRPRRTQPSDATSYGSISRVQHSSSVVADLINSVQAAQASITELTSQSKNRHTRRNFSFNLTHSPGAALPSAGYTASPATSSFQLSSSEMGGQGQGAGGSFTVHSCYAGTLAREGSGSRQSLGPRPLGSPGSITYLGEAPQEGGTGVQTLGAPGAGTGGGAGTSGGGAFMPPAPPARQRSDGLGRGMELRRHASFRAAMQAAQALEGDAERLGSPARQGGGAGAPGSPTGSSAHGAGELPGSPRRRQQ